MPTDTVPMPIPDNGSILVNRDEISLGHSDEAMREYAAQVAAAENYGLLSLLYDIRVAAGDKEGRLMQSELVAHIAALSVNAGRYLWLRDHANTANNSAPMVATNPLDFDIQRLIYGEELDAAIDNAMTDKRSN